HRTEYLLLSDLHIGLYVGEHRRLHVIALVESLRAPTAACYGRTFRAAGGDVALHARQLAGHRQRSHLGGRIERIAHVDVRDSAEIEVEELLLARLRHEDAGEREADLPGDRHGVDHEA